MQNSELRSELLAHWKIVICSLAFLCYVQTIGFPFAYDDQFLIGNNVYITSFGYLPRFFTTHLWDSYDVHMVNFYRPLLLTWSLINHALFGLNPIGWHLTNVLLHTLATYLVCLLAEKFSADRGIGILAGLIFALHPVHLEVVAWASAASDMLLAIFVVGSMICYLIAGERQQNRRWQALAWLFYAAALFSKEPAVMMPLFIFGLAWLRRSTEESFKAKALASLKAAAPFVVIVCGYYITRLALFGGEHYSAGETITLATMVQTWPLLLCFYLKLLLFPFHMSPLYDVPSVTSITQAGFIVPVLLITLLGAGLLFWSRRDQSKVVLFACLWIVWLAPAFYIRAFAPEKKAGDRYLYLASVGFCILAAAGIRRIRLPRREFFGVPGAQSAAALALAMTLTGATLTQEMNWSSDLVLFYRASRIAPRNDIAKENLAIALMMRGRYERALPLLLDVVRRKPKRWPVLNYAGLAYYHLADYQHAIDYLSRAIEVNDADAQEYAYLGLSQLKLAQPAPAAQNLQIALRLKPDQEDCHFGLGLILEQQGMLQAALNEYEAELKLQPTNAALQKYVKEVQARISPQSAMQQPAASQESDPKL